MSEWNLGGSIKKYFEMGLKDGDILSHEWLKYALEINDAAIRENEFVLLERVEAFKSSMLLHHKIALQNVRGVGYRIVPPSDQAKYAAEECARHIKKGLSKASNLLDNTRTTLLSSDEKKRHTDTQVRVAALHGMVNVGQRDVFKLFDKKRVEV